MFEMIFNRTSLTRFCLNLCFKSLKLIIASTHVLLVSSSDRGACASGTGISRFTKLLELPVQLLHLHWSSCTQPSPQCCLEQVEPPKPSLGARSTAGCRWASGRACTLAAGSGPCGLLAKNDKTRQEREDAGSPERVSDVEIQGVENACI